MPDLVLHNADAELVASLQKRAAALGVSMEEAHRMALQKGLASEPPEPAPAPDKYAGLNFKEMLMAMPYDGPDEIFERHRDQPREVRLDS